MKRMVLCLALFGLPATVGVAAVCRTGADQAWRQRVREILAWNKAHPAYVKSHHLDRDMSAETRRAKERLIQRLDMCQFSAPAGWNYGGFSEQDPDQLKWFLTPEQVGNDWDISLEGDGVPVRDMPLADSTYPLINEEDHPVYTQTYRKVPDSPYLFVAPGGFIPGYLGGGVRSPGNPSHPSLPMAQTPEPLPFGFVAFGAAFFIIRRARS